MKLGNLVPVLAAVGAGAVAAPVLGKVDSAVSNKPYIAAGLAVLAGGAMFVVSGNPWVKALGAALAGVGGYTGVVEYVATPALASTKQSAQGNLAHHAGLQTIVGGGALQDIVGSLPSGGYSKSAWVGGSAGLAARDPRIVALRGMPSWAR
jgi:hypothetical protein